MMIVKSLVVICCLVVAVLAGEKYTDKYDNINVQEILENKRLLTGYVDCMMERGKCTPEGKELKNNIQDALETGCDKCTRVQKDKAVTVIEHLIEHERGFWNELCAKYDPKGEWRMKYEDSARAKGIIIPKD